MQIHYTNDLSILNLCVIPLGRILFPGSVQVNKRYIVRLSEGERETLRKIISTGEGPAYKIRHAHILLKADAKGPNWTDEAIADTFSGHPNTVANIRQRLWSTVWKQPWHPGSASIGLAGWMGGWKPRSWLFGAAPHRKAVLAGPCASWRINWWS
jgi:hypothetical protein